MWVPSYGVEGLLKAGTALVSVITAIALWPLMPRLIAIPSRQDLEAANNTLRLEVSERRKAQSLLESAKAELEQALHDDLTGLAGRNLLSCIWEASRARARRANTSIVVMMIDLDGFKGINDRFGHIAGDAVLVTVSSRLKDCVRGSDCIARVGGDEFVILADSLRDLNDAFGIAEKIIKALEEPIDIGDQLVTVGASIGFATTDPCEYEELEAVIGRADCNMYDQKSQRRQKPFLIEDS